MPQVDGIDFHHGDAKKVYALMAISARADVEQRGARSAAGLVKPGARRPDPARFAQMLRPAESQVRASHP